MANRKPTALKLLEGNRGKRPLPPEPRPRPKATTPPKDLDRDAKRTWRRLAPILERLGLLTEADTEEFAEFCTAYSRLLAIRRTINAGAPVVLENGIVNPLYVQERHLRDQVRKFAAEFGLTPRGRVGLTVAGTEIDEFADL